MKTVTDNTNLSEKVGSDTFLLTHFELEGPTCSVKKRDIEGTSEGDLLQRGDANGVEVPWVNPKLLNFKAKYKQRVYRLLERFAVRRGPTYCFTESNYAKFSAEFAAIKSSYDSEAQAFAANLDNEVEAYIARKPHLAGFVNKHRLSSSDVLRRFRFEMAVPTALQAHNESEQEALVLEVERGFWRQIADKSRDILQSLSGKEYAIQRSLAPIRTLADLMFNNSTLSRRVSEAAGVFWSHVRDMPKEGPVEGSQFMDCIRYLGIFASGEGEMAMDQKRDVVLAKPLEEAPKPTQDTFSAPGNQPEPEGVLVQQDAPTAPSHQEEVQVTTSDEPEPASTHTGSNDGFVGVFNGGVNTIF